MKKLIVTFAVPLAMLFAAEKPAAKPGKRPTASAPKKAKAEPASTNTAAPKLVVPPGFGPQVSPGVAQPAARPAAKAQPAAKPAPASAQLPVAPPNSDKPAVTVPSGATEIAPGVFRATDSSGKTWLYRKTPFGITKVDESQASGAAAALPAGQADVQAHSLQGGRSPFGQSKVDATGAAAKPEEDPALKIRVVQDLGDRVLFERPTPFGVTRWESSKNGMSEFERKVLEREQKKSGTEARP